MSPFGLWTPTIDSVFAPEQGEMVEIPISMTDLIFTEIRLFYLYFTFSHKGIQPVPPLEGLQTQSHCFAFQSADVDSRQYHCQHAHSLLLTRLHRADGARANLS